MTQVIKVIKVFKTGSGCRNKNKRQPGFKIKVLVFEDIGGKKGDLIGTRIYGMGQENEPLLNGSIPFMKKGAAVKASKNL